MITRDILCKSELFPHAVRNMFSHYFQLTAQNSRAEIISRANAIVGFCYYWGIGTNVNKVSAHRYFEQSKIPLSQINSVLGNTLQVSQGASSTSSANVAPIEATQVNAQVILNDRQKMWESFKYHGDMQEAALCRTIAQQADTIRQQAAEIKQLRDQNVDLQMELESMRESQRWVNFLEGMVDKEKARRDQAKLAAETTVANYSKADLNASIPVAFLYDKSRQAGDDLAILAHSAAAAPNGENNLGKRQKQSALGS